MLKIRGANILRANPHLWALLEFSAATHHKRGVYLSAANPHVHAPSTCPMHAGIAVYTSAALHADA
eukprot:7158741-Pyramimonas_sp.AAC.1